MNKEIRKSMVQVKSESSSGSTRLMAEAQGTRSKSIVSIVYICNSNAAWGHNQSKAQEVKGKGTTTEKYVRLALPVLTQNCPPFIKVML